MKTKDETRFDSAEDVAPKDVNGDKIPDLMVQNTAGNCCLNYTILSLGESLSQQELPEFISFSKFKKEIYDSNKWKAEPINYECPY